ncbi:MAG: NUDIX domain-containing protein [Bacteroidales bacterium]|nr:NUDIX domain-containing protein [Bacteroidales bacterium]
MYKVFFNDRAVFLTDDFRKNFQHRYGLFYKYRNKGDLEELIEFYAKLTRINSLILFHYDIEELRDVFRSCFAHIDAAGGVVKNEKGEYLFIFRRGRWDLPKGKLDEGESYQQAALREVGEETGLQNLELCKPLLSTYHTYPFKGALALKKTYWFEMAYKGRGKPVPQTTEDIEEVRWFKPDELHIPFQNTYLLVKDLFIYLGQNIGTP